MRHYTERQVIMISKIQSNSLNILRTMEVNVSQFIRQAIKEKLQRDWKEIKQTHEKRISNKPDWL